MIFENGQTIVFTGDSVTDCGRKRPYGEGLWEGLGNGYVRNVDSILSILYPDKFLRIVNTGTSGATSGDLLASWQHDVLDLKPDWVFVMIGANDVWRQFDEPCSYLDDKMPDAYEKNIEQMILRTKDTVKGMYILSPFYMEANNNDAMKKRIVEYAEIAKKVAEKYAKDNVKFIDLQPGFDEHLVHRYPAYISWDRVHPNWVGGMLIAKTILQEIGAKSLY